ncbi:MAG: hypothetical protein ACXQTW_08595 [Candidatus Methanospirareceae archaeon]
MVGLGVAKEAFEVFSNVRETIAFYMFIVEEAIQSAGMAAYISYKAENYERAKEIAQFMISELIEPLKEFAESPAGWTAYPMNLAYISFAESARKVAETYLSLEG